MMPHLLHRQCPATVGVPSFGVRQGRRHPTVRVAIQRLGRLSSSPAARQSGNVIWVKLSGRSTAAIKSGVHACLRARVSLSLRVRLSMLRPNEGHSVSTRLRSTRSSSLTMTCLMFVCEPLATYKVDWLPSRLSAPTRLGGRFTLRCGPVCWRRHQQQSWTMLPQRCDAHQR